MYPYSHYPYLQKYKLKPTIINMTIRIIPTKVLDISIIKSMPKLIQNKIKPIHRIMDISQRGLVISYYRNKGKLTE